MHNGYNNKLRKPSNTNTNFDHSKTVKHADGSVSYTDKKGNTVKYNVGGYPDFSPYSKKDVEVPGMNGNYSHDSALANKQAGLSSTPDGYVWHHVEDGKTMQLIPKNIHNKFPHTGGASGLKNGTLPLNILL
ncbi:HNH endonuclease [Snodgrassella sp. B3882]|uniref:HNH endonuclease n=1 Tax=Snodgrassella sp. B3882 TaxID=2818037 RepID=UPI00226A2984|nr:HNH endonuclease [Snodgrassella sp. B3882]MCX8745754.1 HNH endonuclease [Snodgrassella sp. B3882]